MIKAMNEVGFKPKMWGGAMVGLQTTVFKTQLGPLLNGVVNFETWLPVKSMEFPGSLELLKKYQARAQAAGTDPLGYYMPVWAYALFRRCSAMPLPAPKALTTMCSLNYIRKTTFKPWSATSHSANKANGRRSVRWRRNSKTSKENQSTIFAT